MYTGALPGQAAARSSQAGWLHSLQAAKKRRARSGIGELQSEWEEQGLSREAAVLELITLRREVGPRIWPLFVPQVHAFAGQISGQSMQPAGWSQLLAVAAWSGGDLCMQSCGAPYFNAAWATVDSRGVK